MATRTQGRAKIPAFVILLAVAVTTIWPILFVTFTALGCHRLNALTGPPDHERQDWQWQ